MNAFGRALAVVSCIVLGACASSNYTAKEDLIAEGSAFTKALNRGYVGLTWTEGDEADWTASKRFAAKAKATQQGQVVDPEDLSNWAIPAEHVDTLADARARLLDVFARGGIDVLPETAAEAQVAFDCWVQEQEENRQPDDIARCRQRFEQAMAILNAALAPPEPEPEPMEPEPEPMAEPEPQPITERSFLVFFDWDSDQITGAAADVLDQVAATADEFSITRLVLTGHADRSGPNAYNMALSERRAQAVFDALLARGMSGADISSFARGEEDPLVPTEDGVREPQNRRVEIVLEE